MNKMADYLTCELCGLDEDCLCPRMEPSISGILVSRQVDVMFVGEAPGADEDRQGTPFVGRSGSLLREIVDEVGLQHYCVMYTNVCHCRPPGNKTPTRKQIGYCINNLLGEINEFDPQVIMLLGNTPLKALLGESGITKWRGVVVERDGRTYVPTFHPAYVLRNHTSLMTVIQDFEKVLDILTGEEKVTSMDAGYEVVVVDNEDAAKAMQRDIISAGLCSFDTEVTSLRPFDFGQDIVMCSFTVCSSVKRAWAVIPDDGPVLAVVLDILQDPNIRKVGHNIKFDALAVYALWSVWIEGIVGDSMLLSYLLDSQPGHHGLKMLAGRHLGMYDYDKPLRDYYEWHKEANPKYGGDLRLVPRDIMTDYAAKDAIATIELHNLLNQELTPQQHVLYEQLLIPASAMLTQMQANGVEVDFDVVDDYIGIYADEKLEQLAILLDYPEVAAYCRKREKADSKFKFNPNSPTQIRELLFNERYYGLEPRGYTDTSLPSTKWDFIKEYVDEVPFVGTYRMYKLLSRMLNTYLMPALENWPSTGDDERVRSSYLLHGSVTGRLSSRKPNLQNIPTPEKEPGTLLASHPIKNIFTHTHPDGCLLSVDYSGMELRTMASISGCVEMAKAFEEGKDVHSIVTSALYDLEYGEFIARLKSDDPTIADDAKAMRYRAKWVNWTLLFGGSAYTLHRIYGLGKIEASELVDMYYSMFPEVLEYKNETLAFAKEHGYVESPFGRRRYLPYINDSSNSHRKRAEREALNMPIQSAASDVLVCALIVIDEFMQDRDMMSLLVNTVHDSAMFDVWPGELEILARMCKDVMEGITTRYGPERFPGLPFDWFTVPLVADMEVGSHYGALEYYSL